MNQLEINQIRQFIVDSVPHDNQYMIGTVGEHSGDEKKGGKKLHHQRQEFRMESYSRSVIFDFYQYPPEENKALIEAGKQEDVTWTIKRRESNPSRLGEKYYYGDTPAMTVSTFAKRYGQSLPQGVKNALTDVLAAYRSDITLDTLPDDPFAIRLSRPNIPEHVIFQISQAKNDRNVHGRAVFQPRTE